MGTKQNIKKPVAKIIQDGQSFSIKYFSPNRGNLSVGTWNAEEQVAEISVVKVQDW